MFLFNCFTAKNINCWGIVLQMLLLKLVMLPETVSFSAESCDDDIRGHVVRVVSIYQR